MNQLVADSKNRFCDVRHDSCVIHAGQIIWSAPEGRDEHRTGGVPRGGDGIFVVIAGLARWTFTTPDKKRQV